jgi:hypothetical protein
MTISGELAKTLLGFAENLYHQHGFCVATIREDFVWVLFTATGARNTDPMASGAG